jgi:hypothetical protein
VGVAILLGWIPQIDPRLRRESERSERSVVAFGVIRIAVTAMMTLGSLLIAANALGYHFDPHEGRAECAAPLFRRDGKLHGQHPAELLRWGQDALDARE